MSSEQNKRFPDRLAGLSDLFFNYEHPSYDALELQTEEDVADRLHDAGKPDDTDAVEAQIDTEVKAALVADAEDFRNTFCLALAPLPYVLFDIYALREQVPSAEAFADDFLARL